MKPPAFEYFCPSTLAEAVELLASQDNAKVLAGGQSLMAMLNLRYLLPDALVDINGIAELAGIGIENEKARIGAMTRQRDIERHSDFGRVAPIFTEALRHVGHRQTRNRGTIGGSLCHLDPAAELAALCLLFDAEIEVAGRNADRRILPIAEFIAGFMMPNIEPHEVVSAITIPLWRAGHGFAFREFARRHGDFAIASAGCLLEFQDDLISRASIVIGGIGSVPQRLHSGEKLLVGTTGDSEVIKGAVATCAELEVLSDFHGSAEYRLSVAQSMLRKSLLLALSRARDRS